MRVQVLGFLPKSTPTLLVPRNSAQHHTDRLQFNCYTAQPVTSNYTSLLKLSVDYSCCTGTTFLLVGNLTWHDNTS